MFLRFLMSGGVRVKKVAVIPNISKDKDLTVTKKVIKSLERYTKVCVEKSLVGDLFSGYAKDNAVCNSDCAIVIGGDGTILKAAYDCAKANIPILGVNLGRIGFMTEVEISDIDEAVDSLIKGDFVTEERMMLKAEFQVSGKTRIFHALYDVVISKTDNAKLINMDLFSGQDMINRYIADGLIISTPTGSTGYSLSAGGPVVNPLMKLFVATPMCAHMLTARPAVMPADEELRVVLNSDDNNCALITIDGEVLGKIYDSEEIKITKSRYKTKIIKIKKQSFYSVFTGKLS